VEEDLELGRRPGRNQGRPRASSSEAGGVVTFVAAHGVEVAEERAATGGEML
jgi:hypothetical protein